MSYEKQTWNKYDDLVSEEENIQNGAVVTDNRMNHMEEGISTIDLEITSHESNKTNPHSVTKEQVGLSNVSNYGIATEAEATAGTSDEKYMTPALTKKAAKSYVDKTDIGLPNVDNVKQASKTEFDAHSTNKSNPHGVTAAQIGTYTKAESDTKFASQTEVGKKANDSEVVHLTGDETIAGEKTFTDTVIFKDDTDWQETVLSEAFKGSAPQWKCYRGKEVRVNFSNLTNNNQLSGNTTYTIFNLPLGYRPLNAQEDVIIIRVSGSWTLTRLIFNTNGTVQIVPANTIPVNTGFSGTSKISIE